MRIVSKYLLPEAARANQVFKEMPIQTRERSDGCLERARRFDLNIKEEERMGKLSEKDGRHLALHVEIGHTLATPRMVHRHSSVSSDTDSHCSNSANTRSTWHANCSLNSESSRSDWRR